MALYERRFFILQKTILENTTIDNYFISKLLR